MKNFIFIFSVAFAFFSINASASTVSAVDVNAVLNEGSCGQDGCSLKVCSVEEKKCSFYVCGNAQKCKKVRTTDMSAGEIKAAKEKAESQKLNG